MTIRGGMFEFVLEFLQAIVGKNQKEFNSFVGRLGVANLVCFHRREIVLLRLPRGTHERRRSQHEAGQKQETHLQFHRGFSVGGVPSGFSAGGAASCFSKSRLGNSIFSISSSMLS